MVQFLLALKKARDRDSRGEINIYVDAPRRAVQLNRPQGACWNHPEGREFPHESEPPSFSMEHDGLVCGFLALLQSHDSLSTRAVHNRVDP
jgi:hypothetical protein